MTRAQGAGVPQPSLHSGSKTTKNIMQNATRKNAGRSSPLIFNSLTNEQKHAVLDMASALDSFWAIFLQSKHAQDELTFYLEELAQEYLLKSKQAAQ